MRNYDPYPFGASSLELIVDMAQRHMTIIMGNLGQNDQMGPVYGAGSSKLGVSLSAEPRRERQVYRL